MAGWYILDENHNPIPEPDMGKASLFFGNFEKRCVAQHDLGVSHVSTVFLGLDHNYTGGPPLLFETLVQGGPLDGHMDRYPTWDASVAGHTAILRTLAEPTGKHWYQVAKAVAPVPRLARTAYERLLEDD